MGHDEARSAAETWVGFHTFRHTCATVLFRSGWNAAQVCRQLGHSDPGFTLRRYVHLLDTDLPEPTVLAAAEASAVGNAWAKDPPKLAEMTKSQREANSPCRAGFPRAAETRRDA